MRERLTGLIGPLGGLTPPWFSQTNPLSLTTYKVRLSNALETCGFHTVKVRNRAYAASFNPISSIACTFGYFPAMSNSSCPILKTIDIFRDRYKAKAEVSWVLIQSSYASSGAQIW